MKTEDKRPTPEEELRLLHTGLPGFRPAYELDPDMSIAWFDALAPGRPGFTILDVLPEVTARWWPVSEIESLHASRLAQLAPAERQAHVAHIRARRVCGDEFAALPTSPEAGAALYAICEAANAAALGNTGSTWQCAGPLREIGAAFRDLRMAVDTASSTPAAGFAALAERHALAAMPARLATALMDFELEALPAILRGSDGAAGKDLTGIVAPHLNECLTWLAKVIGNLQTTDQQAAEADRWVSHGWGLLPVCAQRVHVVVSMTCAVSSHYAPAANAEAIAALAALAGEWQSVEEALGRLHAASRA